MVLACFRSDLSAARLASRVTPLKATMVIVARIATTTMTMSSSTMVKAEETDEAAERA